MTPSDLLDPRRYYDRFAPAYEGRGNTAYHAFLDGAAVELVLPLAEGAEVLEIGSGTGLLLREVAPAARRARGIDLSLGMTLLARRRLLTVEVADATALPFASSSFDLCYSFKVLSHVPDLVAALKEVARVLRPGGSALLEVYNRWSLRYALRRLRGGREVAGGITDDRVFLRYYPLGKLRRLLPPELELQRVHGIRIFTLLPASLGWPLMGRLLHWAERQGRSRLVGRLGGFLVLECRRCG